MAERHIFITAAGTGHPHQSRSDRWSSKFRHAISLPTSELYRSGHPRQDDRCGGNHAGPVAIVLAANSTCNWQRRRSNCRNSRSPNTGTSDLTETPAISGCGRSSTPSSAAGNCHEAEIVRPRRRISSDSDASDEDSANLLSLPVQHKIIFQQPERLPDICRRRRAAGGKQPKLGDQRRLHAVNHVGSM